MSSYQDFLTLTDELEIKNTRIMALEAELSYQNAQIKSISQTLNSQIQFTTALSKSLSFTVQGKDQTITALSKTLTDNLATISLQRRIITVSDNLLEHHKESKAQLIKENERLREEVRISSELADYRSRMVLLQRSEMERLRDESRGEVDAMREMVTRLVVENEDLKGRVSSAGGE